MQFVVIDTDEDDNRRVVEFLGLKEEAMPTMRIIQMKETDIIKYKPESTAIEEENIRGFIEDFNAGKVPVHYLSEKTPEDWDSKPVKVGWAMNDTNRPISFEENLCSKFEQIPGQNVESCQQLFRNMGPFIKGVRTEGAVAVVQKQNIQKFPNKSYL